LSKQPPQDDPAWSRVKAETRPLRRKKATNLKRQPTPTAKERPIRAAKPVLVAKTATDKPSSTPAREDGHRRVRRGKIEIHRRIDLHGFYEDEARERLLEAIHQTKQTGGKTLLVITGKGLGGKGVLRRALPVWLAATDFASLTSGYAQAHLRHGGSGAWYVFLKQKL